VPPDADLWAVPHIAWSVTMRSLVAFWKPSYSPTDRNWPVLAGSFAV
jgi:hypothetical protein